MTKKKALIVDPPSGWLYGFPKPCPVEILNDDEFRDWLIREGYPISLTNEALLYSRWWESEIDVDGEED